MSNGYVPELCCVISACANRHMECTSVLFSMSNFGISEGSWLLSDVPGFPFQKNVCHVTDMVAYMHMVKAMCMI